MQKVSGSAWEIYSTSTDRQYLVSYYMNRQGEARSILLSQGVFFIFEAEQTPDFLPCPRVSQSDAIPLTLKYPNQSALSLRGQKLMKNQLIQDKQ